MAISSDKRGREAWVDWSHGVEVSGADAGTAQPLPMLLRRRATPVGQMAFAAAMEAGGTTPARFVFASRHGEFSRTLSLLRTLAADEPVSPADFSLSVHNALAGLLSIASKNQEGHTSLAAAGDTFACGLLEAAATLAASPKQPVLLVYYDEPLPPPYDTFGAAGDGTMALALLLGAPGGEGVIELDADPDETVEAPSGVQQALGFLRFYLSGAETGTSPGSGRLWHWRRAAH